MEGFGKTANYCNNNIRIKTDNMENTAMFPFQNTAICGYRHTERTRKTMRGKLFANRYGYFDHDGWEYVVTNPYPPRPWSNIICPGGGYGVALTQTGTGMSWHTNVKLNMLNVWKQDLFLDRYGRFIYVRDQQSGEFWSLSWMPAQKKLRHYACRHGVGYTAYEAQYKGISSNWLIFVPPEDSLELWKVKLKNNTDKPRTLRLCTFLEWSLGISTDTHREFSRRFIRTEYFPEERAILASNRLWQAPFPSKQVKLFHWPYIAFIGTNQKVVGVETDKEFFIGRAGTMEAPRALTEGAVFRADPGQYRKDDWDDPVGTLAADVTLNAGEEKEVIFTLGLVQKKEHAFSLMRRYQTVSAVDDAFCRTKDFWKKRLEKCWIKTPDKSFDILNNIWFRYQAMSARMWGRTGYYQLSGAFGFRDQLQDSLMFLPSEPEQTEKQILLHASHQYRNGYVAHWWHTLTEWPYLTNKSDDLLWLPFVVIHAIRETADYALLARYAPYLDGGKGTLYEHCTRSIDRSLSRVSARGVPLILEGDWNDGMCLLGSGGKGESTWMAHFLYGILTDFIPFARGRKDYKRVSRYTRAAQRIRQALNKYCWDGKWFYRATHDNGTVVGSHRNTEGRIFLNAQTWSVIHDSTDDERKQICMDSARKMLVRKYGPLLLTPAFTEKSASIGYLSLYAPGVRENGGVYSHAGVWYIQAEVMMGRGEDAWEAFRKMSPVARAQEPDIYKSEPYTMPGNVEGPDSPHYGEGGWTWYTGSAAWMFRVGTHWLLGIRPEERGLRIAPVFPGSWKSYFMERRFRGSIYRITVKKRGAAGPHIIVNGKKEILPLGTSSVLLPAGKKGKIYEVIAVL